MNGKIEAFLRKGGADLIRFADLSALHLQSPAGYPRGVVFCMALTPEFILAMAAGRDDVGEEYLEKEAAVEALADRLARWLESRGYRALSQSERSNRENGILEQGYVNPEIRSWLSPVPQKTLARLAGLGFMGRNNLLVTPEYGCGLAISSVLTDAPFRTPVAQVQDSACGSCRVCSDICPGQALSGQDWSIRGGRAALLDISKCCCPLNCMVHCPWTLDYARREKGHREPT